MMRITAVILTAFILAFEVVMGVTNFV